MEDWLQRETPINGFFGNCGHIPYFSRQLPKSTGREDFGIAFAKQLFKLFGKRKSEIANLLHTLTRLTAWSIADAYERFLPRMPDETILCGGGADNPVLVQMLRVELGKRGETIMRWIDEFGIPNKAKEAASFALLGAATLDGVCGNLAVELAGTATGSIGSGGVTVRYNTIANKMNRDSGRYMVTMSGMAKVLDAIDAGGGGAGSGGATGSLGLAGRGGAAAGVSYRAVDSAVGAGCGVLVWSSRVGKERGIAACEGDVRWRRDGS